jgi:hypothetical protein
MFNLPIYQLNAGISCGRVRRTGGPARRVPCRRRDGAVPSAANAS